MRMRRRLNIATPAFVIAAQIPWASICGGGRIIPETFTFQSYLASLAWSLVSGYKDARGTIQDPGVGRAAYPDYYRAC